MKECITHHKACDCREELNATLVKHLQERLASSLTRIEQLEAELEEIERVEDNLANEITRELNKYKGRTKC